MDDWFSSLILATGSDVVSDISTDEIIDTFAQSMSWLCDDVNTYYDMYYFLKVEFASWYYV